jgi:hypothetical protein
LSGNTYTTEAIRSDCTIVASFGLVGTTVPTLSLVPRSVKTFAFSWADVSGETEYRLLENPDGMSGFSQVATIAQDATIYDLEVFLPGRINASYILQACSNSGCNDSDPVFVSGMLTQAVGYVKASNTGEDDQFGDSVALSADGSTLAVGASWEASNATGIDGDQSDNSASRSGAVYVFSRIDGFWSQQAYVKASNTEANDVFGSSIAISTDGSTLAVGAYEEASSAIGIDGDQSNNSANNSGAVYVFTRDADVWSQQAYLKASNTRAFNWFGHSVAISGDGDTLAVGAHYENSNATGINGDQINVLASQSGAVYVFGRNSGTWSQDAYVKASNTGPGDWFGVDVALSEDGRTLAVGARTEDSNATGINGDQTDNSAIFSGSVYVFDFNGGTWNQQAYVKASNTQERDYFGREVVLSADGDTLAVATREEDSNATGIDGEQSDNSAADSGAVYVFNRDLGNWSQQAYIKASNTDPGDSFGWSIALSADGSVLAVGARDEDSGAVGLGGDQADNTVRNSGAVYIFERDSGIWSQQSYVKAPNTETRDYFGVSVALSGDSATLAVGAYGEASSATGIDGNQADNSVGLSGALFLY